MNILQQFVRANRINKTHIWVAPHADGPRLFSPRRGSVGKAWGIAERRARARRGFGPAPGHVSACSSGAGAHRPVRHPSCASASGDLGGYTGCGGADGSAGGGAMPGGHERAGVLARLDVSPGRPMRLAACHPRACRAPWHPARRAGAPCHAPAPMHGLGGRCGAAPAPRQGTLRARLGRFGWRRHTRSCASAAATWCRCRRRGRRRAARGGRASRRPTAATAAASTAASRGARSVRAVWLWLSWPARASCSRHLRRLRRGWSCGCCHAPARRLTPAGRSRVTSQRAWGGG